MDLAIASIAILLQLEGNLCHKVRIAAGSVAPVPLRLHQVEKMFEGEKFTQSLLRQAQSLAASCVSPISDVRSSADYRRQIIGVYLKRSIEHLVGWNQQ